MIKKYVALLRGINVGGNNKVEMARLKVIFESLGFKNVKTYINSGNVIFSSDLKNINKVEKDIEKAFEENFRFPIRVVVRDSDNIQMLCKEIPKDWKNDKDQKTDVIFLWSEFDNKNIINLIKINPEVDNLKYLKGAVVWNLNRNSYNKSGMHKFIGTEVYKNMTARNINTVRKLGELMKNS